MLRRLLVHHVQKENIVVKKMLFCVSIVLWADSLRKMVRLLARPTRPLVTRVIILAPAPPLPTRAKRAPPGNTKMPAASEAHRAPAATIPISKSR